MSLYEGGRNKANGLGEVTKFRDQPNRVECNYFQQSTRTKKKTHKIKKRWKINDEGNKLRLPIHAQISNNLHHSLSQVILKQNLLHHAHFLFQ